MTYYGETEAPQIKSDCPQCGLKNIESYKNYTAKGKGTHVMRVFLFKCPEGLGCGKSFRRARSERPEEVPVE